MSQQKYEVPNEAVIPAYVEPVEKLVGQLFICAFLCNKVRDFPIGFLEPILANIAITCFALAYFLQLFTIPFYQLKSKQQDEKLINYRSICFIIALIGAASSVVCMVSPQLWLQCLWVFCANNLLWIYNEKSRAQEETLFPKMPNNHESFVNYVIFISFAPFCSAIAGTLKKVFFNSQFIIDLVAKLINWSLTIFGLIELQESSKLQPS